MKHSRTKSLPRSFALILAFISTAAIPPQAHSQQGTWRPEKPVELIIGATPGGAQDHTGRTMQKILQDLKLVPTTVNIVNKGGASGGVAVAYMSKHPGDGHFLTIISASMLTNHITGRSALGPSDFTPIAIMGSEYIGVVVRTESPLKSGKDLVELLRKQPDALSVAVGLGLATTLHLSYVSTMKAAGVDIKKLKTVTFSSGGEAITALLGGHLDASVSTASNLLTYIRSGRMRMLVIGAPERIPGELSTVPTWRELGIRSSYELWRGLAGPKNMSRGQIQDRDETLGKVVASKEWHNEIEASYMVNTYKNSAATGAHWKQEYDNAKELLTELGFAK